MPCTAYAYLAGILVELCRTYVLRVPRFYTGQDAKQILPSEFNLHTPEGLLSLTKFQTHLDRIYGYRSTSTDSSSTCTCHRADLSANQIASQQPAEIAHS